jgi:hypothetical protein
MQRYALDNRSSSSLKRENKIFLDLELRKLKNVITKL